MMSGEVLQGDLGGESDWNVTPDSFVQMADCNLFFPDEYDFRATEDGLIVHDERGDQAAIINNGAWRIAWRSGTKVIVKAHGD